MNYYLLAEKNISSPFLGQFLQFLGLRKLLKVLEVLLGFCFFRALSETKMHVCRCFVLRGAERSVFAQEHVKMISFFPHPRHPSAFHLFTPNFPRHLLVGFNRFSYKHYDGLTIYLISNFRPPKTFFGELFAKKFNFRIF